jgi:hypothetical protein
MEQHEFGEAEALHRLGHLHDRDRAALARAQLKAGERLLRYRDAGDRAVRPFDGDGVHYETTLTRIAKPAISIGQRM